MGYPNLAQVKDPALARALKVLCDRLNVQEQRRRSGGGVIVSPTAAVSGGSQQFGGVGDPADEQDGVTQQFMFGAVQQAIAEAQLLIKGISNKPGSGGGVPNPPPDDILGPVNTDLSLSQPGGIPARPNLRWFRGNMCGLRIPGLGAIPGGAADASLVMSWLIDRYTLAEQNTILAAHQAQGFTHFLLSWPDSRGGPSGYSVAQYVALAQLVQTYGMYPVHFLGSKDYDAANFANYADLGPVLDALKGAGAIPIACAFWEGNLWIDPQPTIQAPIDFISARLGAGTNLYVHFSEDTMAWQPDGQFTSYFWNSNQGKLTGLLHQKRLTQGPALYQARLADVQGRFGGGFGFVADSGFGHPFDVVACEIAAMQEFGGLSTAEGDALGLVAIGSIGAVPIQGYLNGCTGNV